MVPLLDRLPDRGGGRGGDDHLADDMRRRAQGGLAYGPRHVDEAIHVAQAMLVEAAGGVDRAMARRRLGRLLAMRGELDEARALVYAGTDDLRDAGLLIEAAAGAQVNAFVEIRAGAITTAERVLREGAEELESLGSFGYYTTTALQLANVLAGRGAYEEAARWCGVVREKMSEDDLTDVIRVDALEGFLTARNGEHAEGERLATHAVELASAIDLYNLKAEAYEWLARTLAIVGKPREAREAASTALAIYEAKGDLPAIAWARDMLDSLPV